MYKICSTKLRGNKQLFGFQSFPIQPSGNCVVVTVVIVGVVVADDEEYSLLVL